MVCKGEFHQLPEAENFRPAKLIGLSTGIAARQPARAMASARSPTKSGANFVLPPPSSGKAGARRLRAANLLKKLSSGPNTIEGLRIMAPGKSCLGLGFARSLAAGIGAGGIGHRRQAPTSG